MHPFFLREITIPPVTSTGMTKGGGLLIICLTLLFLRFAIRHRVFPMSSLKVLNSGTPEFRVRLYLLGVGEGLFASRRAPPCCARLRLRLGVALRACLGRPFGRGACALGWHAEGQSSAVETSCTPRTRSSRHVLPGSIDPLVQAMAIAARQRHEPKLCPGRAIDPGDEHRDDASGWAAVYVPHVAYFAHGLIRTLLRPGPPRGRD